MNKADAQEFCNNWLPAWSGNQPESLIRFYADHIYYRDPARPQGLNGTEELFQYFRKLLAKYPHWVWKMVELFPYDHGFILKWEARLDPTQKDSIFGLDILEIENGKIIRNEVFFDPSQLIK